MPWTRKQVKLLLSDMSPLSDEQKQSMQDELHADPSMGHAKKGSAELKRPAAKPPKVKKPAPKPAPVPTPAGDSQGYTYNWKQHQGRPR